jgi:multidrug efflux pump subunit AcrA (membrane-fusion protein)
MAWPHPARLALTGLLALPAAPACAPPPTTVQAAEAAPSGFLTRGDFVRELLLTGELRAVHSIEIKAPETELFQIRIQFMAEEGSFVRKGEPLLDFDNSGLAEQVQELESRILDLETQIVTKRNELSSALKDLEIELAEKEYAFAHTELEASVDPAVLSRKEHGERLLAFEKATRELSQTREKLELTRSKGAAEVEVLEIDRDKLRKDLTVASHGVDLLSIEAPADGLVVYQTRDGTTLRYQEGDSCWPGQTVLRLPDLSQMEVLFHVNEVDAPLLQPGLALAISVDAFPGRELSGRILRIPSMAVKRDEQSDVAVFEVPAELSQTWVGEMKPGMSTLGRVVVERRQNVPLVSRSAVRFDGEHYWMRDEADPTVFSRKIEPVARNERHYVLSEDEYARLTGASGVAAAS